MARQLKKPTGPVAGDGLVHNPDSYAVVYDRLL